jgi:hypothetical protein
LWKVTIYTKSSQICAHADDTVKIVRSTEKIIEIYIRKWKKSREDRIRRKSKKNKYMIMSTSESR